MARAAVSRGLKVRRTWRPAVLVERRLETTSAATLVLDVPSWPGHLAGQHVDVRLTAPDGYQAARSYSLAAPADGERIEITVQAVPDGEVSSFLVETRHPVIRWRFADRSAAGLCGSQKTADRCCSSPAGRASYR